MPKNTTSAEPQPAAAGRLPRRFYARDTVTVAHDLLGKHLVHVVRGRARVGRIVEVEAYLGPHDRAAHSSRGLTPRTRVMFGPPGHAYVYLIYGLYHCLNLVTQPEGTAAAVLLRALEPVQNVKDRTSGPGLLCHALGIDMRHNGMDLLGEKLYVSAPEIEAPFTLVRRPRIGIAYAGGHWARRLLRFYIKGNEYVSRR